MLRTFIDLSILVKRHGVVVVKRSILHLHLLHLTRCIRDTSRPLVREQEYIYKAAAQLARQCDKENNKKEILRSLVKKQGERRTRSSPRVHERS